MRRQIGKIAVGALVVVAGGVFAARAAAPKPTLVGEVNAVMGAAERAPVMGSFASVAKGDKLTQGDRLRTQEGGRLEAKLLDGSILRLGEKSELALTNVSFDGKKTQKKKVEARLVFGRLWAAVTKLIGEDSKFEVTTDNAVAGVRGTVFAAAKDEAGTTVRVYDGRVLISNKPIYAVEGATKAKRVQVAGPQEISKKQWEELVASAMQLVRVSSTGEMSPVESFKLADAGTDDWEQWNRERDKLAGLASE